MPKQMLARVYTLCFAVLISASMVYSAPLTFVPIELEQPDGTVLHVFASGDEFYNWVHDKDNFTIVRDPVSRYYVYAVLGNGVLLPSLHIVGKSDPAAAGLVCGVNVFPETLPQRELAEARYASHLSKTGAAGAKYNLVVFIRFKDELEFKGTVSEYDQKLNSIAGPSLKHYYGEVSWNQMDVSSSLVQAAGNAIVSYEDSQPRKYFLKYDSVANPTGYINDQSARENGLLRRALTSVLPQIPSSLPLDGNGDGRVDNVIFIVSGSAAGWADLLWPHMSGLSGSPAFIINGKTVITYNFQLEKSFAVGVLCHELGHSIGMPDLYRYTNKAISPCGSWDIMCSGSAHMTNYLKFKYGKWIASLPVISASGTYWVNVSTSQTRNIYKIASPRSTREYFLVEYRKKKGFYESLLPADGLIVYRVNDRVRGNASGPPDEVYVYRPGGTLTVNGKPSAANFSSDSGRTAIDDTTNPPSFLSDGMAGGLSISNIGTAGGDSISFDVKIITNVEVKSDYAAAKAAYSWIDVASSGTEITNWMNAGAGLDSSLDDGYTSSAIPLGFDFTFYGQKYNSVYVGINGLVSFTQKALNVGSSGAASVEEFGEFSSSVVWPGNALFPHSIAVAYNDFNLNRKDSYGGGRIVYATIGDQFVLSWLNVGTFARKADTTNTFQLVLNRTNGGVRINFKTFGVDVTRKKIKVGMQKDQTMGLGWLESGDIADRIPTDGSSVEITPVVTSVAGTRSPIPDRYTLEQNYPNPFNPSTRIRYTIPGGVKGAASLRVYDVLGRVVAVLADGEHGAGTYDVTFNAAIRSSGIYIFRLSVTPRDGGAPFTQSRTMVYVK